MQGHRSPVIKLESTTLAGMKSAIPRNRATEPATGIMEDVLGGVNLLQPACVHHGNPVAYEEGLFLVVGDVHCRDFAGAEDVPDLGA